MNLISFFKSFVNKQCRHKWQPRGRNKWYIITYRVCLKCGESQERVNKSYEKDRFKKCEPITHLDNQFDANNNYIF